MRELERTQSIETEHTNTTPLVPRGDLQTPTMQRPSYVWCEVPEALAKTHIPGRDEQVFCLFFQRTRDGKEIYCSNFPLKGSFCLPLLPTP